jgi:hypothetical protein
MIAQSSCVPSCMWVKRAWAFIGSPLVFIERDFLSVEPGSNTALAAQDAFVARRA